MIIKNRIFPSWEEIDKLKTPLTDGEYTLAKFFDTYLPVEWEIYLQPYLNGDRPDIVLLNPNVGLVIYEIKDWNLDIYKSEEKIFLDKKQNKNIVYYQSSVLISQGDWQKIPNPISQIERYRKNLLLYLPQLATLIDENQKRLASLKMGIYFHKSSTIKAQKFIPNFEEKYCLLFGNDKLNKEHLNEICPDINVNKSYVMNNYWANQIRFWLKPPFHSIEQGQPIVLSDEQKRHILPSEKQHQRLRGAAGSGKTLIIAQRGANLASIGKKILVVTYNITLWHHIRDNISRARYNFDWEQFEFNHFHGFCKNYLYENDIAFPDSDDSDANDYLDNKIPELIIESMINKKNKKKRCYDAILIDEGQDYSKKYYEMLCKFLTANDEVFLVADEKQNIYSRELSWLENMQGTKFKGRWRELNQSYRLPFSILKQANKFAKKFLPDIGLIPEPIQGELFGPKFIWRNIDITLPLEKLLKAFEWLTKKQNISPSDIVILLPTHKEGLQVKQYFENKNIKVNDVFEEEKGNKRNKHSFWMGDSRLKMSTVHSFKGWELQNIILVTPDNEEYPNIDFLMYIAITRVRENIIVFNRVEKYNEFGESWNNK
ncbi:MAG: UvrD-helicase domain-containing protein [Aliarcobacter sp.]|uniref:UvrD-helicase domain-containing protein n=1 Tax=Aliarcobacter sp. TaxID=2321116 RepID=UPI00404831CA|nr:UvrD-helicase domain-containing protein [Aliarcobacter sp.]